MRGLRLMGELGIMRGRRMARPGAARRVATRLLRLLGLTTAGLGLGACTLYPQFAADSGGFRVRGQQIQFVGKVDSRFVEQLAGAVRAGATELDLASPGGEGVAAYRAGELIRTYHLNVFVTGPCISACSVIVAAGQHKTVLPGGYLGYHWNMQSNPEQVAQIRATGWLSDMDLQLMKDVENTFNAEVGVQQALYDDAWLMTREREREDRAAGYTWLAPILRGVWLPTPQELSCYGLQVDTFWFPPHGDLDRLPPNYRAGPDLFTTAMLRTRPPGVSGCVAGP